MYKMIKGDIITMAFNGDFDAIVHGANCFNKMDGGLALQIKNRFPSAFEVDKDLTRKIRPFNKLGMISFAAIDLYQDDTDPTQHTKRFHVVNAYSQYYPGPNLDYGALTLALRKVAMVFKGKKIALPLIGCGIAGGEWEIVEAIVRLELESDCDVTVVSYDMK